MKKLLLHACCAPCAIMPHLHLKEKYDISLFFYNPNIHDEEEFIKRRDTLIEFANAENIDLIILGEYIGFEAWAKRMPSLKYPLRCSSCYDIRLEESAKKAKKMGFDAYSSSLLYSRYQKQEIIVELGNKYAIKNSIFFDETDFRPFWYEGIKASKEKNMYRQKFCGCGLPEKEN